MILSHSTTWFTFFGERDASYVTPLTICEKDPIDGVYLVLRRRVLCGEVEEELLHVPVEQRLQVYLQVERQVAEIILKQSTE